jgi:hypothetical protein
MRELPILFKAEMHRAIRERRKTETRRLVKMPKWAEPGTVEEDNDCKGGLMAIYGKTGCFSAIKPRYQVGDRLWVKEAICPKAGDDGMTIWNADGNTYQVHYRLDDRDEEVIALDDDGGFKFNKDGTMASPWSSPLHMPKWAARTWLEVTGVRAERLQEITEEGADAEGVSADAIIECEGAVGAYSVLWDQINGKGSWEASPWVWVYQFKLLEAR